MKIEKLIKLGLEIIDLERYEGTQLMVEHLESELMGLY